MNLRRVARLLGIICLLIGGFMVFSLPWAYPELGVRNATHIVNTHQFETRGFAALLKSCGVCLAVGSLLLWWGRSSFHGPLYRKETMAVVGLSWIFATVLGALPYYFAGVYRGPAVLQLAAVGEGAGDSSPTVAAGHLVWRGGLSPYRHKPLTRLQRELLSHVLSAGAQGRSAAEICGRFPELASSNDDPLPVVLELIGEDPEWRSVWLLPGEEATQGSPENFRIRNVPMSFVDAMFESQSGFSTTGATVISQLEDPQLVPHCILFWRSSTHFLGGLGIIVLFVAILGHGSTGKALMREELPGPTHDRSQTRMQQAALTFAATYIGLTIVLIGLMKILGMTLFDAACHAFGTMATGGFSTYNASLAHFQNRPLEFLVIVFMILAGTNFSLLILSLRGKPLMMLRDIEWQTYVIIILVATLLVVLFGLVNGDFHQAGPPGSAGDIDQGWLAQVITGIRLGLFQVVSILTTTGYGTCDFDRWNHISRAILLLLMFVGGCAGSTGGGVKVIRTVLLAKILRQEIEHSYHPSVVRPLKLAGQPVNDPHLRDKILVYFALIGVVFAASWILVVMVEADTTWDRAAENKLIDSASIVAATLNNIGPGLGTVGPSRNYGQLSPQVKLLCTWLMMLGRVEVFVILCLFSPRFWRTT